MQPNVSVQMNESWEWEPELHVGASKLGSVPWLHTPIGPR